MSLQPGNHADMRKPQRSTTLQHQSDPLSWSRHSRRLLRVGRHGRQPRAKQGTSGNHLSHRWPREPKKAEKMHRRKTPQTELSDILRERLNLFSELHISRITVTISVADKHYSQASSRI